jgi:hypothetical protein
VVLLFVGLNSLISARGLEEGDVESLESLYDLLKKLCRLPPGRDNNTGSSGGVTRRGAMRAGLDLFARHARLFAGLLVTDVAAWYAELRPWCDASNRDDHRAGWRAMSALLVALGEGFEELAQSKPNAPPPPGLTYLLGKFKALLTAAGDGGGGGSLKDVSLAVQGYGQLARPLNRLLAAEEYRQLVHEVLTYMEQLHLEAAPDQQRRWALELAASHLAACANLLTPLLEGGDKDGGPPEHLLFSLETLAVTLVRKFARLPLGQYQAMAVAGLRQVLALTATRGGSDRKGANPADALLETIVHQVVLSIRNFWFRTGI